MRLESHTRNIVYILYPTLPPKPWKETVVVVLVVVVVVVVVVVLCCFGFTVLYFVLVVVVAVVVLVGVVVLVVVAVVFLNCARAKRILTIQDKIISKEPLGPSKNR